MLESYNYELLHPGSSGMPKRVAITSEECFVVEWGPINGNKNGKYLYKVEFSPIDFKRPLKFYENILCPKGHKKIFRTSNKYQRYIRRFINEESE